MSELVADAHRGAALGMTNFFAVIIGTTVMPLVGGVIADLAGLRGALMIGIAALALVAVAILMVRDTAPRVVARGSAGATPAST